MGRKDTLAAKSIRKMYEQLNLNQSDIFSKTKLLLSVYRDVVWITLSESTRVNEELVYYGEQIKKDKSDGIKTEARYTTVNEVYELWKELKRGLKNNTFENYKYMYETFVRHQIGSKTVSSLKKNRHKEVL